MSNKERLLEILDSLRPKEHFYLDADPWYSCPSHPDYRGDDDRTECYCDFDKKNRIVDEAVSLVSEFLM